MKNGGWGQGDEGLPAASMSQRHWLDLSWSSRKPTNLDFEFVF
jgi:hypothetical protein